MKLIADTSVIIAVITNENTKSKLVELTSGYALYAPTSIHCEIGNAVSAMYKRKSISEQDGYFILNEYKKMPIAIVDIDLIESLKISYHHNLYAYDAYMIRCAIEQKAKLITLDKKLAETSNKINIKTIEVN